MECGQFDKRNKDYNNTFSKKEYFRRLLLDGPTNNKANTLTREITILDVGAHGGESASFFNEIFPTARIFSFEPIPEMADIIRKRRIVNNMVIENALSNYEGNEYFYIQNISHLSSLHKVNKDSKDSLGYHKNESHKKIKVEVKRGDLICEKLGISAIDLLKVDVQANEVQTLQGFSSVIHKVKSVLVEVSFYDFYEHKSSLRLIEEQLPFFELYDIFEISKNPKTMGTDWATIVYKNKNLSK